MAINSWRGDAQEVSQVSRLTVGGTVTAGDVVTATINRKEVSYTAQSGDTLALVASGLYDALSASTIPEFAEVTWSYTTGDVYVVGTGTGSVPFTVTASVSGGATLTLAATTPTAASGPNHYDVDDNWSLGTKPTSSDDTVIGAGASLLYGGGTIAGNTISIRGEFSESIGLPKINTNGYVEYRTRYVTFDSATVKVGEGAGTGSSQLFVKAIGSSTWTIVKTAQRQDESIPALDIDATGNPTRINIAGGDVGLCVDNEGTSRTFGTVAVNQQSSRLTVGRSVTITSLDFDSGIVDVWGVATAVAMKDGEYTQRAGTLTAITCYGGYVRMEQSGTVTSAVFRKGTRGPAPTCDCSDNNLARTFTNAEFTGGSAFLDPNNTVTHTNPYTTDMESLAASDIGSRFTVQRG